MSRNLGVHRDRQTRANPEVPTFIFSPTPAANQLRGTDPDFGRPASIACILKACVYPYFNSQSPNPMDITDHIKRARHLYNKTYDDTKHGNGKIDPMQRLRGLGRKFSLSFGQFLAQKS
jgi:hypothetical protein